MLMYRYRERRRDTGAWIVDLRFTEVEARQFFGDEGFVFNWGQDFWRPGERTPIEGVEGEHRWGDDSQETFEMDQHFSVESPYPLRSFGDVEEREYRKFVCPGCGNRTRWLERYIGERGSQYATWHPRDAEPEYNGYYGHGEWHTASIRCGECNTSMYLRQGFEEPGQTHALCLTNTELKRLHLLADMLGLKHLKRRLEHTLTI
jgi:hypothetical protein